MGSESRTGTRRALVLAAMAAMLLAALPGRAAGEEEKKAEPSYRMTTYVVGFLYRGPAWTPDATPEIQKMQADHLAHIGKMADSGRLILAGPFMDNGDLRGLLVFKIPGDSPEAMVAEAERMASGDPMIQAGRLVLKLHPWYSADGINIDQSK